MAKYINKILNTIDAYQLKEADSFGLLSDTPDWFQKAVMLERSITGSIKPVIGSSEMELRMSGGGIRLIRPGDFIICQAGKLRVLSEEEFNLIYKKADDAP